jgi:hypothetical protein
VALSFDSKWNTCHKRRHCLRIAVGVKVCTNGPNFWSITTNCNYTSRSGGGFQLDTEVHQVFSFLVSYIG